MTDLLSDNQPRGHKLASRIVDEFRHYRQNQSLETFDFESSLDMFENKRSEKDYDWMSDIAMPMLPSVLLTDAAGWTNQYFQTRDFVEAHLEQPTPESKRKAKAASTCINQTLNRRNLHHFQKYVRARTINALSGQVYVICEWKQRAEERVVGTRNKIVGDAENMRITVKQVKGLVPLEDHFDYEVVDPRNVATDSEYSYSIQEKNWITFRYEASLESLEENADVMGLFNLDKVREFLKDSKKEQSKVGQETYDKNTPAKPFADTPSDTIEFYLRMGKDWAVVIERNKKGDAVKIKEGTDEKGDILEKAELIDVFSTVAMVKGKPVLIRFQPNPFRDGKGRPYKPVVRGWCYLHPTKDTGLSDGKYLRDLQIALSDTLNMAIDRTRLSTLPTFIGSRNGFNDTSEFFIEPEHVILVDNPQTDLRELNIQDNVAGAMQQINMLDSFAQRVASVGPTTMGELGKASATATAVAGAESRGNIRSNYKSLTFEYTFLTEFYWMILQMTYQFAMPQTKIRMLGEYAKDLDPDEEYSFTPVSSNIETEYNKYKKIQLIDQMIGRIKGTENPKTPALLNYMLQMVFDLLGEEFPDYKNVLLDQSVPGGKGQDIKNLQGQPTQNQTGLPMQPMEQAVRSGMSEGQING